MRFKMVSFRGQLSLSHAQIGLSYRLNSNVTTTIPTIAHESFNTRLHHELFVGGELCTHKNVSTFRIPPVPSRSTFFLPKDSCLIHGFLPRCIHIY